jgi:hypothetical protein
VKYVSEWERMDIEERENIVFQIVMHARENSKERLGSV